MRKEKISLNNLLKFLDLIDEIRSYLHGIFGFLAFFAFSTGCLFWYNSIWIQWFLNIGMVDDANGPGFIFLWAKPFLLFFVTYMLMLLLMALIGSELTNTQSFHLTALYFILLIMTIFADATAYTYLIDRNKGITDPVGIFLSPFYKGQSILDSLIPGLMQVYKFRGGHDKAAMWDNTVIPDFNVDIYVSDWLANIEEKFKCCGIEGCQEYSKYAIMRVYSENKCRVDCPKAEELNIVVPGCGKALIGFFQPIADWLRWTFAFLLVSKLLLAPIDLYHTVTMKRKKVKD